MERRFEKGKVYTAQGRMCSKIKFQKKVRIVDLPEEIILEISDLFFKRWEIVNLLKTCKYFYNILKGEKGKSNGYIAFSGCSNVVFKIKDPKFKEKRITYPFVKHIQLSKILIWESGDYNHLFSSDIFPNLWKLEFGEVYEKEFFFGLNRILQIVAKKKDVLKN